MLQQWSRRLTKVGRPYIRRLAAAAMAVCLLLTLLPAPALATGTEIAVTAFDELEEAVARQIVPENTPEDDLKLPQSLGAAGYTVQPDTQPLPGQITIENVIWTPEPAYTGQAGSYTFTPTLPAGYLLAAGVALPTISVLVRGAKNGGAPWSGGGNAADDPFLLTSYADLKTLAANVSNGESYQGKYFKLDESFPTDSDPLETAIGTGQHPFQGRFNGNGKTVELNIQKPNDINQGLFGCLDYGTVENVTVCGTVTGYSYVGGVVGNNKSGTIKSCHNAATVTDSCDYVGGVAGFNNGGTMQSCFNTSKVTGKNLIGGMVGYNVGGAVQNCYNAGAVKGDSFVGGIVGKNQGGIVESCYNAGTGTRAESYIVGGIVGENSGTVQGCVSLGLTVTGPSDIGRVVGRNVGVTLTGNKARTDMRIGAEGSEAVVAGGALDNQNGADVKVDGSKPLSELFGDWNTPETVWTIPDGNLKPDCKLPTLVGNTQSPASLLPGDPGGKGNPYLLTSYADLRTLAANVNNGESCQGKYFKLDESFPTDSGPLETAIGTGPHPFQGHFDGNGRTVELNIQKPNDDYQGLFGNLDSGTVENMTVSGTVTGFNYVGGVVGQNTGGNVESCYNTGTITGGSDVGGVVGQNTGGTVKSCYNTGTVTGGHYVGGVVGVSTGGTVQNCYNTGTVTGGHYVGGVVGFKFTDTVENCVSLGLTVTGTEYVGRVMGSNSSGENLTNNKGRADMRIGAEGSEAVVTDGALDNQNGADVKVDGSKPLSELFGDWNTPETVWIIPGGNLEPGCALPTLVGNAQDPAPTLPGVAIGIDVSVAPAPAEVQRGTTQRFTATVTGRGDPSQAVGWSVEGNSSGGTSINESGLLTVAADETAERLTVRATSVEDNTKSGTAAITVVDTSVRRYLLTVNGGSGTGEYAAGAELTIAADPPAQGKRFQTWTASGVTLADSAKNPVSFQMPVNPVTLTAVYEDASTPVTGCIITFNANGGAVSPASARTKADGRLSGLPIPTHSGSYRFDGWYTAASGGTRITTETIFTRNAAVYAHWSYTGGSSDSDSGSGSGSSGNSDAPSFALPAMAKAEVKTEGDGRGGAETTVQEGTILSLIEKAKEEANRSGSQESGPAIQINVTAGSQSVDSLTVNLPEATQQQIIGSNAQSFALAMEHPDLMITLSLTAVREINRQAKGDVQLTAARVTDLSGLPAETRKLVGKRPIFRLTITCQDGAKSIESFGGGSVFISIPYQFQPGEAAGGLQLLYIDELGKARFLKSSSYDPWRKLLLGSTKHFSLYAVGCKAPAAFSDIASHWAREDIEFVSSRSLLEGEADGRFNPDGAITRAAFMTALGRLAGVDPASGGRFTDVPEDADYAPYAEWAAEKGIFQGEGRFEPNAAVTRQEMAAILAGFAKAEGDALPAVRGDAAFSDSAEIAAWASGAVQMMQRAGVLMAKEDSRFDPDAPATRAQVSAALRRYIELCVDWRTTQGWEKNDSGQQLYYEDGKPVTGQKSIGGTTCRFDQKGLLIESAAAPETRKYLMHVVKRGDTLWTLAERYGCTVTELVALNGGIRNPNLIFVGQGLKIPQK